MFLLGSVFTSDTIQFFMFAFPCDQYNNHHHNNTNSNNNNIIIIMRIRIIAIIMALLAASLHSSSSFTNYNKINVSCNQSQISNTFKEHLCVLLAPFTSLTKT